MPHDPHETSNLDRLIVSNDPIAALMIARRLAREGLDTSNLFEAAIAALNPHETTVKPLSRGEALPERSVA